MVTSLKVKNQSFGIFHTTFEGCLRALECIDSIREILEAAEVHNLQLTFESSPYANDFTFYSDEWGLTIRSRSHNLAELEEELDLLDEMISEKILNTPNIECIKINQNEYSPDIINFLLENFNVKFIN